MSGLIKVIKRDGRITNFSCDKMKRAISTIEDKELLLELKKALILN